MFDEVIQGVSPPENTPGRASLADTYVRGQAIMDRLYNGDQLREAVQSVLAQLPPGPLSLISTSTQGGGLAAACAAARDEPTHWGFVSPSVRFLPAKGSKVIVVEAVDAGAGWRQALLRRYPDAAFIFAGKRAAVSRIAA